ncbi:PucR family transcriptional regulator [Streptomyces sp. NPDC014734]|uniref:PucR family transcriptional regulator n=1 Tax=Streptomyces sp. NPDC014734 TaxID=3364886 RepID=UPI0036F9CB12
MAEYHRAGSRPPGRRRDDGEDGRDGDDGELRRALAVAIVPEIDELTRRVVADIHAHSDTYASGMPVSRDDLREICRDNLLRALEDFGGLPPSEGDFEHAARETGRRRAEQNVPLDTVLQAYRRGGRVMWQVMTEHLRATRAARATGAAGAAGRTGAAGVARTDGAHRDGREVPAGGGERAGADVRAGSPAVASDDGRARGTGDAMGAAAGDRDTELDMAGAVWETIDRYSLVMAESYRLTRLEMQGRQDTRRVALFEALLDGRGTDPAVAASASAALGVPVHDRYVVVAAAQDPAAPPNPAPVLDDHGIWSFWRPRSGRYAGIVRLAAGETGVLLDLLRHRTGATAGVSPEFDRLSGAGSALRLAEQALRTLPVGSGEVASFDDRLPEALLVGRPEISERIVAVHLGAVLDTAAERDTLLGTLRVWLDSGCSAARAAERLYCHRNTVLNRIGRIAELTGRSPDSGDARLGWALALRALPLSGTDDRRGPSEDGSGTPGPGGPDGARQDR